MQAEVLSIGSELLSGAITDTNATYLALQLSTLGVELRRVTQVGDRMADLTDALRDALARADLVVCTGGIGPTPDDLTREAIAEVMGESMTVDPGLEATLRSYFGQRSYPMPEQNIKQATLIPSATTLPNRSGTAPGWWVERDERIIVTLPGVPREMRTIWAEEVAPRLTGRVAAYIVSHTFKTTGLGESTIAAMLGPLVHQENPSVATYAKRDGVHVTVRGLSTDERECRHAVELAAAQVQTILDGAIWGANADTLQSIVMSLLEDRRLTLSTHEHASTGLLAIELSTTGSSAYLGGGFGGGTAPPADYTLCVRQLNHTTADAVGLYSCDVVLERDGVTVGSATASAASGGALTERATVLALDLLRRSLISSAADPEPADEKRTSSPGTGRPS